MKKIKVNTNYIVYEYDDYISQNNVYKIGLTGNIFKRMSSYPKGSILLFMSTSPHMELVEKKLIQVFGDMFLQRFDRGHEYFQGDLEIMKRIMIDTISYYNNTIIIAAKDTNINKINDFDDNYKLFKDSYLIKTDDSNIILWRDLISIFKTWYEKTYDNNKLPLNLIQHFEKYLGATRKNMRIKGWKINNDKIIEDLEAEKLELQKKIEYQEAEALERYINLIIKDRNDFILNTRILDNNNENVESFLLGIQFNSYKTAYNIEGYSLKPQINKYKGHINLAKALYDDKNHPENKTFYWNKIEKKAYYRMDDNWVEIELLALTNKIIKNIGTILTPVVFKNSSLKSPLQSRAQEMFNNYSNNDVKIIMMEIVEFLTMERPKEDEDGYIDYIIHRHWHQIRKDYQEWIKEHNL